MANKTSNMNQKIQDTCHEPGLVVFTSHGYEFCIYRQVYNVRRTLVGN